MTMQIVLVHGILETDSSAEVLIKDWCFNPQGYIKPTTRVSAAFWGDLSSAQEKKTLRTSWGDKIEDGVYKAATNNSLLKDCYNYFYNEELRAEIQQRFFSCIAAMSPGDDVCIISHSQGTVIAYECLLKMELGTAPALPVVNFTNLITIGSPLGLEQMRAELRTANSIPKLHIPKNVWKWENFNDIRDLVAAVHKISSLYPVKQDKLGPETNPSFVYPIQDIQVVNPWTPADGGFFFHDIDTYLQVPVIRDTIRAAQGLH
jgi:hypothetical protein